MQSKKIVKMCKLSCQKISKYIATIFQLTTPNASLSDNVKEMARYDLQQILSSDLIVADISRPSTGLGIEICTALSNNKKVLFFANSKSRVSMLLIGYMDKKQN